VARLRTSRALALMATASLAATLGSAAHIESSARATESHREAHAAASTWAPATAAPRRKHGVIVAAGDISRHWIGEQARTARLVRSLKPTRVLALGDLQYPAGAYRDFVSYYDPTWGQFNHKLISAPGNHEYETPHAAGYLRYFGKRAHPFGRTYFSRNVRGWHIVSLDSNIARGAHSKQVRWLRRDLRGASQDCVLALWHHPLFTSGTTHGHDPTQRGFWRALYRARADVILNGHEHNYERFAKQRPSGERARHGIREWVVGTGGATPYPFGRPARNSQRRVTGVFGVLELTLHRHAYAWRFVAVGGKVLDRGRAACN
jgi:hypothetical protein